MSSAPVQPHQRIQYLDVVRGFAITGVLIAYVFWNLGTAPAATYTRFDKILDEAGFFLIDSKCYTLLANLFAVGFVLHMHKAASLEKSLVTYRRRLLGLMIIGLLHALLLRNGDILLPYAVLSMLVTLFYRSANRTIVLAMVICFFLPILLPVLWKGLHLPYPQRPGADNGGYLIDNFIWVKFWYTSAIFFWETTLFFLFSGLLLGRVFIQNKKRLHAKQVNLILITGLIAGTASYLVLSLYASAISRIPDIGQTQIIRSTIRNILMMIHRVGLASAYAALFYLLLKKYSFVTLASLGRMSLTNYILQAIIVVPVCIIFHLFDHITPSFALMMSASIWIIEVVFSRLWLAHYRFGPLEWLLRRFTYGKSLVRKDVNEEIVLPAGQS